MLGRCAAPAGVTQQAGKVAVQVHMQTAQAGPVGCCPAALAGWLLQRPCTELPPSNQSGREHMPGHVSTTLTDEGGLLPHSSRHAAGGPHHLPPGSQEGDAPVGQVGCKAHTLQHQHSQPQGVEVRGRGPRGGAQHLPAGTASTARGAHGPVAGAGACDVARAWDQAHVVWWCLSHLAAQQVSTHPPAQPPTHHFETPSTP